MEAKLILLILSILLALSAAFLAAGIIRLLPTLSSLLGDDKGNIENISRELSDLSSEDPSFRNKIRDSLLDVVGIIQRADTDIKDESKNMSILTKCSFLLIILSAVIQVIVLLFF